jgi:hypothetical protein
MVLGAHLGDRDFLTEWLCDLKRRADIMKLLDRLAG